MSEFVEVVSPSALKELQAVNAELIKTIAGVKTVNENMIALKTPSGSDAGIKKLADQYLKLEANISKAQIMLEKQAQAQNRTIISNNNVTLSNARVEASIERKNKALDREKAKLEASQSLYGKIQAKLNLLSNEYKNLASKKELGLKLTDNEAKRYDYLSTRITKYDNTLKAVDASMGKYQRNVGNYASGFNPLSNSINQLTREMPAFANSVQTGFMAISNNLPIFFDAIQQANAEIKLLRANGEATPSLFQKLTTSVLSWGTALSVGVTLLTVFGDEIVDAIFNTKAKTKADEDAKAVIEKKNKAEQDYIDTIRDSASQEISNARLLFENAKNRNIPLADRIEYIKQLREAYPSYLKALSDEDILAGRTAEAEEKLNEALMKRGIAIALQEKISEAYKKVADAMIIINQAETNRQTIDEASIKANEKLGISRSQAIKNIQTLNILAIRKAELDKKNAEAEINNLVDLYNKYAPYLDSIKKAGEERDRQLKQQEQIKIFTERYFESEIQRLEDVRKKVADTTLEYASYTNQINVLKMLLEQLQGVENTDTLRKEQLEVLDEGIKKMKDYEDTVVKTKEETDALRKSTDEWIKSFSEGFFSDAGLPTFFKILNKELDGFGENFTETFLGVTQVAQEAFAFLNEMSNQRFENEYNNLSREKEIALAFAGESATARAEIERQYEERQRAIRRREFNAKKQQTLFNIAIDTAQAIVATLARTPLPAGLPFVIATGAIGAAQAAIVASQQAPQFWTGTDNAPEGWAITQEKGREIITDKNGNIKSKGSDKGAQLTYLNRGDKVLNNEKTMDYLMFNNDLNNILTNNAIGQPIVEVNNKGISDSQVNKIVSAIENKAEFSQLISNGDLKTVVRKGNTETEIMNRRINFKGKNV